MKIYLRDNNEGMTEAWKLWFKGIEEVEISQGDIFGGPKAHAIVSPANSFGFMDGGIDMAYSKKFGWDVQKRLQKKLDEEHYGELPVGQAVILETKNDDYPWLVSAPTMRVPLPVYNTLNAYLAFRATLIAVIQHGMGNPPIESIICPGLGTSVGQMPFNVCAKQMFYAYMVVVKKQRKEIDNLATAMNLHFSLARDI
jgi:O-acetyl-ADP-ribose deacetylase (regulator of RNase III)